MNISPFSKPIPNPASGSQYDSGIMNNVFNVEQASANQHYMGAMNATQTGIIPERGFQQKILNTNNTGRPQDAEPNAYNGYSNVRIERPEDVMMSSLTGLPMKPEDFAHNNMVPYFRGESKQNMNMDTNRHVMENFTGNSVDNYREKQEVKSFFDVSETLGGFVNGSPIFTQQIDLMSRYIPSDKRQGESPVEKINVGPGLAAGYVSSPSGGLNQANARDYVMPKDTNELRVASKPKQTYEARLINGLKYGTSGITAIPKKYRPDTYYVNNPERYFKNGGEIKAAALREKYCFPVNGRQTTRSYYGTAGNSNNLKPYKIPAIKKSTKHNYMNPTPRNAYRGDAWKPDMCNEKYVGDYGKNSIENVPNERQNTETRTILNNITTNVKKLIVPVQDFFRKTRNENFIGNNRPDGNFKANMPSKLTVHDPEDIARTTLKEQNIHNEHEGFVGGNVRHIVYDPNDVARTTIKETNIHNEAPYINLKANKPTSITVYDPEDIPRTTLKETTIDNDHMGFISKQIHADAGAYTTQRYNAKNTNKQFTSDYEYMGIANGDVGKGGGRGYLATRYNAKTTHKQFLSNNEYTGGAGQSVYDRPSSYAEYYNARLNPNKEKVSVGRQPSAQGAKLAAGEDLVNLQYKKIEADRINLREPAGTRTYQTPPLQNNCGLTMVRNTFREDTIRERIDSDILDQFRNNPYTQSLASAV